MKSTGKHIDASRAGLAPLWGHFAPKGSSAEAVFQTLREAVLSRVLLPRHTFTEEDFAEAFGVSRTPVHEAILRLEAEGLVERLPKRGLMVSDISPDEILEVYEVRIVLDGLAAEHAAEYINPPELAHLRWLNERMRAAGEEKDFDHLSALNLEFHELIAKASRNAILARQIAEVQSRVRRFEQTTFSHPGRWPRALAEHDQILHYLDQGDTAQARQAAEQHMQASRQVRLEMLRKD